MAESSLVSTTKAVRKYLVYFAVFAVVVIILQTCFNIISRPRTGTATTASYFLDKDEKFGNLTINKLPNIGISTKTTPIYNVDNILPQAADKNVNIYKIQKPGERFDSEGNATAIAKSFGFNSNFTPNQQGDLTWTDSGRTLTYNKIEQRWFFDVVDQSLPFFK